MSVHFSLSHNFKRDRISNIPSKPNFLWLNRPCYIITHMCTYMYSVNCTVTSTGGKMWSSILNLITMSKERTRVHLPYMIMYVTLNSVYLCPLDTFRPPLGTESRNAYDICVFPTKLFY